MPLQGDPLHGVGGHVFADGGAPGAQGIHAQHAHRDRQSQGAALTELDPVFYILYSSAPNVNTCPNML